MTDLSWLRSERRLQVQRVSAAKARLQSLRASTEEEATEMEVERSLLAAEAAQEAEAVARYNFPLLGYYFSLRANRLFFAPVFCYLKLKMIPTAKKVEMENNYP